MPGQRLSYTARYYDPGVGRFISADTIVPGAEALTIWPSDSTAAGLWGIGSDGPGNPQDLNRYSYASNSPLRNVDPTGHITVSIGVTLSISGFLDGSISFGVVWDGDGPGLYATPGAGESLVPGDSVSMNAGISLAPTIESMNGPGLAVGASLGAYSGEVSVASNPETGEVSSPGISVGMGIGWPVAEAHVNTTNTWAAHILSCKGECPEPPGQPIVPGTGPVTAPPRTPTPNSRSPQSRSSPGSRQGSSSGRPKQPTKARNQPV